MVGYLDVGRPTAACECICSLQDSTPSDLAQRQKTIMSQYDFCKSIVLSWLDSETDQKWKRGDTSVVMTNNSVGSSNKARRINEVSLNPLSGAL